MEVWRRGLGSWSTVPAMKFRTLFSSIREHLDALGVMVLASSLDLHLMNGLPTS